MPNAAPIKTEGKTLPVRWPIKYPAKTKNIIPAASTAPREISPSVNFAILCTLIIKGLLEVYENVLFQAMTRFIWATPKFDKR